MGVPFSFFTLRLIRATAWTILAHMVGPLVGVIVYTPTILAGGSTALHHAVANAPRASETNPRIPPTLRLKLMPFGSVG